MFSNILELDQDISITESFNPQYFEKVPWDEVQLVQDGIRQQEDVSCASLNLELFEEPKKSTVEALLGCAIGWSGEDMEDLHEEVKQIRTRSHEE